MIKLLYFGDFHNDSRCPKSRIDDFNETRKEKIKEILKIAKEEEVVALLQPGDFLNKAKVSNSELSEIKKEWGFNDGNIETVLSDVLLKNKGIRELECAVKRSQRIQMIGTVGNHELIGGSLATYNECSISQLVESGFIRLVTKDNPLILKDKSGFTVAITGSPFTLDIDGEDKSSYIIDNKLGDFHIHLVHGMLMNKSYGDKFEHTTVQEIIYKTKADLTLNGHDHIGYEPIYLDGKIAYNPGSPVRLSAENKEIERKPKVTIIEIDENGINLRDVYLKSAKDGKEVLTRNHIEMKKVKSNKIAEIKSILNKANIESSYDITDILKNIAKNKSLPENIVKETVDMILNEMNKTEPFNPLGEYYITSLELINFECHSHSYFEFSEGLNILAGESTNGKSSVIRALAELYTANLKKPQKSIRFGETSFKIILTTSHGYEITRIVENKPKGRNKNGWEIYNLNTGEKEYVNSRGISKVQEILGFNYINISDKNKVGINFSMQGKSWFFIGDDMTAPDKAKLLGVPFGTQYADAVLKEINTKSKKVVAEINFLDNDINKLNEEIDSFNYLNGLEDAFKKGDKLKEEINEVQNEINRLEDLLNRREEVKNKILLAESVIKTIENKNTLIENELVTLKEEVNRVDKIENLLKKRSVTLAKGKEMAYVVNKVKDINNLKENLDQIKSTYEVLVKDNTNIAKAKKLDNNRLLVEDKIKLAERVLAKINSIKDIDVNDLKEEYDSICEKAKVLKEIKTLNKKKDNISKNITLTEKIISTLDLEDKVNACNELKNYVDNINKISELINNRNEIKDNIKNEEEIIKKVGKDKEILLSNMGNLLEELGTCPICHSNIDADHIEEVLNSYR